MLYHQNNFLKKERINISITKTCLLKYTENFTRKIIKNEIKNSDIFHISAQDLDCGTR